MARIVYFYKNYDVIYEDVYLTMEKAIRRVKDDIRQNVVKPIKIEVDGNLVYDERALRMLAKESK